MLARTHGGGGGETRASSGSGMQKAAAFSNAAGLGVGRQSREKRQAKIRKVLSQSTSRGTRVARKLSRGCWWTGDLVTGERKRKQNVERWIACAQKGLGGEMKRGMKERKRAHVKNWGGEGRRESSTGNTCGCALSRERHIHEQEKKRGIQGQERLRTTTLAFRARTKKHFVTGAPTKKDS